jgi:hypothetical protein
MEIVELNQNTEIQPIVDTLLYRCYAYNRRRSPEIPPEKYALIFGQDAMLMEIQYQKEK